MIVWCPGCKENWLQVTDKWKDGCHVCEPYSFEEDIIPERCAGYFSPEAIAERWPNNTEPEGRYPYSLETISALLEGEWEPFGVVPRPTPEYNTVNLKELRELRDDVRHYVVYGY